MRQIQLGTHVLDGSNRQPVLVCQCSSEQQIQSELSCKTMKNVMANAASRTLLALPLVTASVSKNTPLNHNQYDDQGLRPATTQQTAPTFRKGRTPASSRGPVKSIASHLFEIPRKQKHHRTTQTTCIRERFSFSYTEQIYNFRSWGSPIILPCIPIPPCMPPCTPIPPL